MLKPESNERIAKRLRESCCPSQGGAAFWAARLLPGDRAGAVHIHLVAERTQGLGLKLLLAERRPNRKVYSFQTTLTPNPEKFCGYCSAVMNKYETCSFECALQMLSSSGANGLEILQKSLQLPITVFPYR